MAVAACIETPTRFARYTVADAVAVPIGTLMKLSGANEAWANAADEAFAGIAWEEKTASDGLTELTCAINGVWDLTNAATGTITSGGIVSMSGANLIKQAIEAEMVTGAQVGKALETAAAGEVIRVRVGEVV